MSLVSRLVSLVMVSVVCSWSRCTVYMVSRRCISVVFRVFMLLVFVLILVLFWVSIALSVFRWVMMVVASLG